MNTYNTYLSTIQNELDHSQNTDEFELIFDLDSTLFDVSHRISGILNEYGRQSEVVSSHPEASKLLREIQPNQKDYGVRRTLSRYPNFLADPYFIKNLVQYWKLNFFSSRFLHLDRPYEGAVDFVRQLRNLGFRISYLTGRDEKRMKEGTLESLRNFGFPLNGDYSNLNLKPTKEILDHEFKNSFLRVNHIHKKSVWFFENEPKIINGVSKIRPDIKIVFVDTVHSESETVLPNIPRLIW